MPTVWDVIRNVINCLQIDSSFERLMKLVRTQIISYCSQNGTPLSVLDMDMELVGDLQVFREQDSWVIRVFDKYYDYLKIILNKNDL